ncbi:MAG: excinuclease ABC subunit C [Glaciecola sp.]|jgi:excinuclease ABC subunit C
MSQANPALAFRPETGTIPDEPGCYQFKDKRGRVVYIGKAKSLRSRLSSYFQAWHNIHTRTRAMLEAAASVEWIVVDTEVEALHLEFTLIQKHLPRYNVRYTDDKSYPYLVLETSKDVPRARVHRGTVPKGDRRFGPYAHAYAIRETLQDLLRVFPVRTCSQGVYDRCNRLGKPCLYFHIEKCAGPCVGEVSEGEHREIVDGLIDFLDGNQQPVFDRLETEMQAASERQEYELAARRRDQLDAARKSLERQEMVDEERGDFDAIAIHEDDLEAAVQAFFVRAGRVVGRKGWTVDKVEELTRAELLTGFLLRLYAEREDDVPPTVLVPELPDEADALAELLAESRRDSRVGQRGRPIQRVAFAVPQRGSRARLMETVQQNARQAFERARLKRASDFNARSQALEQLMEALGMDEAPLRIECFDISHLGGTEVVASMVVFEDALPRKAEYRKFKLREDKNDDYAAMKEVVARRFRRFVDEQSQPVSQRKFSYPPNLVIIDGGPGQLGAAIEGFEELRTESGGVALLDDVRFVSLAKKFEEVFISGRREPVILPRGSEALYLVQRLRDEAHRFAITFQRQRRTSGLTSTALDDIPGVGAARRKSLLVHFGSVKKIRSADVDTLATVPGISSTLATTIHLHLHPVDASEEAALLDLPASADESTT